MATYVNVIYIPVPRALTAPSLQEELSVLANPYSEGSDGAFPMIQKVTLSEIFATFPVLINSVARRLGVRPWELNVGQLARAIAGRPAVNPGTKHDLHVTKPLQPCNTQSCEDNTKISDYIEKTTIEKGHKEGEVLYHEHCDGAAFHLRVTEKVN